jgi:hypothetical protein
VHFAAPVGAGQREELQAHAPVRRDDFIDLRRIGIDETRYLEHISSNDGADRVWLPHEGVEFDGGHCLCRGRRAQRKPGAHQRQCRKPG